MKHERPSGQQHSGAHHSKNPSPTYSHPTTPHTSTILTSHQTATLRNANSSAYAHHGLTSTLTSHDHRAHVHANAQRAHAAGQNQRNVPPMHEASLKASGLTHQPASYEPPPYPPPHPTHVMPNHPQYTSQFSHTVPQAFQASPYAIHHASHMYPAQQMHMPPPQYLNLYPTGALQQHSHLGMGPVLQHEQSQIQQNGALHNPSTPRHSVNPVVNVAVHERPYYSEQAPDPTATRRTVIQKSYYHPSIAQNVVFSRLEINQGLQNDGLVRIGDRASSKVSKPVVSATSISSAAAAPEGPQFCQTPAISDGNAYYATHQSHMPHPQTIAHGASPAMRDVSGGPNDALVPPVIRSGMHHAPYPYSSPDLRQDLRTYVFQPGQMVHHAQARRLQHANSQVLVHTISPSHITRPSQPSPFPEYLEGARPNPRHLYGNTVHAQHMYAQPGTIQYVAPQVAPKKKRLQWTPQLHAKFEAAINKIGLDAAVPKALLQAINEPTLTRENVASHLQKFREMVRKRQMEEKKGQTNGSASRKRSTTEIGEISTANSFERRKNARISSVREEPDYEKSEGNATSRESSKECEPNAQFKPPSDQQSEDLRTKPDLDCLEATVAERPGGPVNVVLTQTTEPVRATEEMRLLADSTQKDLPRGIAFGKFVVSSTATEDTSIPTGDGTSLTGHQELSNVESRTEGTVVYYHEKDQRRRRNRRNQE